MCTSASTCRFHIRALVISSLILFDLLTPPPVRASCALSSAYCTCDAIRLNVTCTRLEVTFDELMLDKVPVTVQHLNVHNNYVDPFTIREEHFDRAGQDLVTLTLINLKIVSVSRSAFRVCTSLEEINLSRNKLRMVEPETFPPTLRKLDLSQNEIVVVLPGTFESAPQLIYIDLKKNAFLYLPINSLRGLKSLQQLYISGSFCPRGETCSSEQLQVICPQKLLTIPINQILTDDSVRLPRWLMCCEEVALVTSVFGQSNQTKPCLTKSCIAKAENVSNVAALARLGGCPKLDTTYKPDSGGNGSTASTTENQSTAPAKPNGSISSVECSNKSLSQLDRSAAGSSALFILLAALASLGFVLSLIFAICTLMLAVKQRRRKQPKRSKSVCVSTNENELRYMTCSKNSVPSFQATLTRQGSVATEISWRDCGPNRYNANRRSLRENGTPHFAKTLDHAADIPNGRPNDFSNVIR